MESTIQTETVAATLAERPFDTAINPPRIQSTVLGISRDGTPETRPCVFLMEDTAGTKFEAELTYCPAVVNAALLVKVGDVLQLRGCIWGPRWPTRDFGNLLKPGEQVSAMLVSELEAAKPCAQ